MPASAPATKRHAPAADATGISLENFIPYRLAVVAREMSAELARKYEDEFGISIPEWRVMAHLAEIRTCSSGDICARTAMDKAQVNRAVTRLAAAGLIIAGVSNIDRRLNVLTLSRRGQAIYQRISPIALEAERRMSGSLTDAERATLLRLLGKLQNDIDGYRAPAT
ncbi:MarR family transcriptional regulator [Rhodoplanes sp. Z2-YC6860]|nr:MarR family transcriptional regulator [Rhodoplanes sp. Z2-YC6860]